jgi:hypothetical protein
LDNSHFSGLSIPCVYHCFSMFSYCFYNNSCCSMYENRLKSSWLHLITPNRNFVEVRWRSLFRSTFFGKWFNSYNAPPTSRKRAADRLPQASGG